MFNFTLIEFYAFANLRETVKVSNQFITFSVKQNSLAIWGSECAAVINNEGVYLIVNCNTFTPNY